MRTLSVTLLAARQAPSYTPYVKLEAKKRLDGATRLDFTRLYTGNEDEYYYAVSMAVDGSLIRVRITPTADGRKLYYQRVTNPDADSDYSQWTYASQYNAVVVATASLGVEVSIFWIKSDRKIQRIKSTDNGATWGAAELIDYSPTTAINGISAAYKPNGDLALFFADQTILYIKKYVSGAWQAKAAWDKTTGNLSGAASIYDGDWNLFITGLDTAGNFKLWSLVYGDGTEISAGTWSELKEIATAPVGGAYEYRHSFLDKTDVVRCFYVEKYSGVQSYARPFWTHTVAGADFNDNLWREAVPFNLTSNYGLAMTHDADYAWLSCANGVWRAPLDEDTLDLSADAIRVNQESGTDDGRLEVELSDADGRYNTLPVPLGIGCELVLSTGYLTSAGFEAGEGVAYTLDGYEYTSSGGIASLILNASDGWDRLKRWTARQQFRWNQSGNEKNVQDMLVFILARCGVSMEVISSSATIADFYPDFSINPGVNGDTVVRKLMSFVADALFIEGNKTFLILPQDSDSTVYSYGASHSLFEGRYSQKMRPYNRVIVVGLDDATLTPIAMDSFDWDEVGRAGDNLLRIEDNNIVTETLAEGRGEAWLAKARLVGATGWIRIPPNCGQQLYDVIDITDARAGLNGGLWRVMGMTLTYEPVRAVYEQKLMLGEA
jgi:hypothetical protein